MAFKTPWPSWLKSRAGNLWLVLLIVGLVTIGCRSNPPKQTAVLRQPDLVELTELDPTIQLDVRYATTNNFTHQPVYGEARAFLQRPAAEALSRANQSLRRQGYGVVVFDGYRPWSVTKLFWETASESERKIGFVANPKNGSKHNRGCAVDLSLVVLATGQEAEMPSAYDEFSERAYPTYAGGDAESRRLRDVLRSAMEAQGFRVYKSEWWHFDYKDWKQYGVLDIPFREIGTTNDVQLGTKTAK
jgi:D-alanyl-D-alanine dipeptidase